jgi:HNH endonuclease
MKRAAKGQFLATPKGEKTARMLAVERRIGRTLEEDFREYHLEKGWGQKRIAARWGVQRNLVFSTGLRGGRRCWAEMLDLPVKRLNEQQAAATTKRNHAMACELCGEFKDYLGAAHWISNKDGGGTQRFNILRLCPNCHRKLDRDDPVITEHAREALLFREAKRIIETGQDSAAKKKELFSVCSAIVTRKIA